MGGLRRGVTYTVNQLMHGECGLICRGAVGEGGLIRGGLLYVLEIYQLQFISGDQHDLAVGGSTDLAHIDLALHAAVSW